MDKNRCSDPANCNRSDNRLSRRDFIKTSSLSVAAGAVALSGLPGRVMAGPFRGEEFTSLVPSDKKLAPQWVASLTARGEAPVWTGEQLKWVGMPVNGIGGGQLYLGGDGQLWYWGMMNQDDPYSKGPGIRFQEPSEPFSPFLQGKAVRLNGDNEKVFSLDKEGFGDIRFHPRFPVAKIEYRDDGLPLEVDLLAFSPFVPMELRRSAYPASIFEFTFRNISGEKMTVDFANWMENPVFTHSRELQRVSWSTQFHHDSDFTGLQFLGDAPKVDAKEDPDAILFADFEGETYGEGWQMEGDAFGAGPYKGSGKGGQKLKGFKGEGMVNTYAPPSSDKATGKLTSPTFEISRPYINFLVAGGRAQQKVGIRLLVDGEAVFESQGERNNNFVWRSWFVEPLLGKTGQIEIYDNGEGGWSNIDVDHIEFSNFPRAEVADPATAKDKGSMLIAVLDEGESCKSHGGIVPPTAGAWMAEAGPKKPAPAPISALEQTFSLAPGEVKTVRVLYSWRFPFRHSDHILHMYSKLWASPMETVKEIAQNYGALREDTLKWVETWYDSTLPHWFLDRTFIPNDCLNANTVELRAAPVEWELMAGEGVNCCGGNCTHVWHYAQGAARLFPDLERNAREHVELGRGYTDKGIIKFRAVPSTRFMSASDGTCGTILRILREHQMTEDDSWLKRVWPKTKKAMQYLIDTHDPDHDGMTTGWQHHTLDAEWAGKIPWLIGMYLAALRACVEMAEVAGDKEFEALCKKIIEAGSKNLVAQTWNADYGYFEMIENKNLKKHSHGTYEGCHIDQILGEAWLRQVGLPPVLPIDKIQQTLDSLYKYNFTPDVGPYRQKYTGGRWYAMEGDAGLLMCTFPYGGDEVVAQVGGGPMGYLNECMSGFEWQVAAHCIWENRVQEGLAIGKAIGDRYAPELRNPFNEIECGDHYARAMAAHGAFLAVCGYRYDGPRGFLAFAPRLNPENFRAPFTTAKGWGSFSQNISSQAQLALLELKHGSMKLKTLELALPEGKSAKSATVTLAGKKLAAALKKWEDGVSVELEESVHIEAGQALQIMLNIG